MNDAKPSSRIHSSNETDFRSILSSSCALALMGIVAAVASIKITDLEGFHVDFDLTTLLWMALAALFNWGMWKAVWEVADRPTHQAKIRVGVYGATLIAIGIFGFLYPLRYLARNKLPDISFGLVVAVFFLGGVATAMYFVARGFKYADAVELARADRSIPTVKGAPGDRGMG